VDFAMGREDQRCYGWKCSNYKGSEETSISDPQLDGTIPRFFDILRVFAVATFKVVVETNAANDV
jgi:hypothetical protein